MSLPDKKPSFQPIHWVALALLALIYAVVVISTWSLGYIDFGDGNYMYIGRRIAEGAVVYRDILAPQPPCHLFLGAAVYKAAELIGLAEPLYAFRCVSLVLHLITLWLVVRLALRAWGHPGTALTAGAIYLWLPIGFWWAMAWQSEPLELVFLLAMVLCALPGTWRSDVAAGCFAALAALTNATAAPFLLVLIIYIAVAAPWRALRMTVPCVALAGLVVGALQWWTGGAFLDNVVFNQVGTFPGDTPGEFLAYARSKLISQGAKILALEGGFIFLAILGVWRLLRAPALDPLPRVGLTWYLIATFGSILYLTKGGTVDYIFSLAGPSLAILAAGELAAWAGRWKSVDVYDWGAGLHLGMVPFILPKLAALGVLLFFLLGPGLNFYALLFTQRAWELPEAETLSIRRVIRDHSEPDERILAPPFYAFISERRLWRDYSELFIWHIKYWNDRRAGDADGEGWAAGRAMAEAIAGAELPLVILELGQTARIPEVQAALRARYVPLETWPRRTVNTRLAIFVPLEDPADPEAHRRAEERWDRFLERIAAEYGTDAERIYALWYGEETAQP